MRDSRSEVGSKEKEDSSQCIKIAPSVKGDAASNYKGHFRVIEEAKNDCNRNNGYERNGHPGRARGRAHNAISIADQKHDEPLHHR
jgi:hypothetical protein